MGAGSAVVTKAAYCTCHNRDMHCPATSTQRKLFARAALHGDAHHRNLLNFTAPDKSEPDWKFIDPKALYGDRTFDYVNIVFNPDLAQSANPKTLLARARSIAALANIELFTYLRWVGAYGCLSALWHLESDPESAEAMTKLGIAKFAFNQALHTGGPA